MSINVAAVTVLTNANKSELFNRVEKEVTEAIKHIKFTPDVNRMRIVNGTCILGSLDLFENDIGAPLPNDDGYLKGAIGARVPDDTKSTWYYSHVQEYCKMDASINEIVKQHLEFSVYTTVFVGDNNHLRWKAVRDWANYNTVARWSKMNSEVETFNQGDLTIMDYANHANSIKAEMTLLDTTAFNTVEYKSKFGD
ncbi:hypothetical protein HDU99_007724 [Rhizoclosmatium hyalinum]|nr:hypothetical protein HDU99_007724 [Rhizoclosmatium hyalinum]